MNYTEWKQEYLELFIKQIKQHKYSGGYTSVYINELANELLGRNGFIENLGYWKKTHPAQAVKECFELWLTDYFED